MGQAKQRGTFEERKAEAQRKQEGKAQWLAERQKFSGTANMTSVRPKGSHASRIGIMGAALAASMGAVYVNKDK